MMVKSVIRFQILRSSKSMIAFCLTMSAKSLKETLKRESHSNKCISFQIYLITDVYTRFIFPIRKAHTD